MAQRLPASAGSAVALSASVSRIAQSSASVSSPERFTIPQDPRSRVSVAVRRSCQSCAVRGMRVRTGRPSAPVIASRVPSAPCMSRIPARMSIIGRNIGCASISVTRAPFMKMARAPRREAL